MKLKFKKCFLLFAFLSFFGSALAIDATVKFNFPVDSGIQDITQITSIPPDENAYTAFLLAANDNNLALEINYFDFDGDEVTESAFVNGINGVSTSNDFSKFWSFSVNNTSSLVGISDSFPNNQDTISLNYLEGNKADAIEWLADNQQPDGQFGSNLFQSTFGLMGLSLFADNNALLDSSVINNGTNFVLNQQGPDARFADELHTAVAIMSLISNGMDLNEFQVSGETSIDFLESVQNADGGFESGTISSDVDTTSWVSLAFAQTGILLPKNNNNSPVDYLLFAQHTNGSWGYNETDATESTEFTEEAIIAMAAAGHSKDASIQNALNWLSSKQNPNGCISDGFRTALGSIAFRAYGEDANANSAVECLKTLQNGDGSFGRISNNSNAMDTGISIIALNNETLPLTFTQHTKDSNGTIGLNSILKFLVDIENTGKVPAKNVNVSIGGIPESWVLGFAQGSIDHFDEILTGQTKTAEIFVQLLDIGSYSISATVSTDTSVSLETSNDIKIDVQKSTLLVSLSFVEQ